MISVCSGAKVVQIRLERSAVQEVSLEVRCPAAWDNKTIESQVWDRIDDVLRHIDDNDWDYMDDTVELVEVGAVVDGECVQLDLT
jgi:hypothetical protein